MLNAKVSTNGLPKKKIPPVKLLFEARCKIKEAMANNPRCPARVTKAFDFCHQALLG